VVTLKIQKLLHPTQFYTYQNLKRFSVAVCGRRWGKTILAAIKIITAAIQVEGLYWWVAPTWKLTDYGWDTVHKILIKIYGSSIASHDSPGNRDITLPGGSKIEFKSADNPDSLRGAGLSGVVVDEAAFIKEEVWTDSLRAALSDREGWAIFVGTPSGRKSWFYHLFEAAKRLEGWAAFQYSSYDNPYIKKEEIDSSKLVMSSKTFAQEHLAQFITQEGSTFKREWFAQRGCEDEIIAKVLSFDTAYGGKGSDFSAGLLGGITSRYQIAILDGWRDRLEFPQLQRQVESMVRNNIVGLRWVLIESKASGASLIQSLKETSPDLAGLFVPVNPTEDKPRRADLVSGWAEHQMILLPKPGPDVPWLLPFEDDLFSFPACEFPDWIDCFTQLLQFLSHYLSEGLRYRAAPEWERLV
jgi:predicted phage terminase large subunit-like protein